MQLDLLPHFHWLVASLEFTFQPGGTLADPQVVKLDALALGTLLAMPVGGFEAVFGAGRLGAKQAVVAVEAVHHRLGDVVGQRRVETLRKHACSVLVQGVEDGIGVVPFHHPLPSAWG